MQEVVQTQRWVGSAGISRGGSVPCSVSNQPSFTHVVLGRKRVPRSVINHIELALFMINKVNVTLLRQFLGLYCPSKLIIRLTHDVFLISLLFRIVSNLNHIDLPLFMNYKVNVTLLRQFLGLYSHSKIIIRLTHDVFLISLLFMIFSSLNQFHLPLFMINKVNVTLFRQFLGFIVYPSLL